MSICKASWEIMMWLPPYSAIAAMRRNSDKNNNYKIAQNDHSLMTSPSCYLYSISHRSGTVMGYIALLKTTSQKRHGISHSFYRRDSTCMLARYLPSSCIRLSACLSVCLSVTRRYCTKMAKPRITQTTLRDSPGTSFWRQQSLVGDAPFLMKFALKVTHPLSNTTISTNIRSQCLNRES